MIDFVQVRLQAPADSLGALAEFYGLQLGVEHLVGPRFRIGATELDFVPVGDEPFYHFAFLVPGDRFDAAFAWANDRVGLLPDHESGDLVFEYDEWGSRACYFEDPAGNILELIAHAGIGEAGAEGPFEAVELLGFSELGLVGDVRVMAGDLERSGLALWAGTLDEPDRLAFVGEKARTLILAPERRGWVPTGRPAEPHHVQVTLAGLPPGEVRTGRHHISTVGSDHGS